jgi:hypothetical protein
MPTVYVLGAGASKHVGYPLVATMGQELLAWMSGQDQFSATAGWLKEEFGSSPNVEDVITELDHRVESLESSKKLEEMAYRHQCGDTLYKIRMAIPIWFREIRVKPAPAYAAFADHLVAPGDTVISFNYDDSLERELKRAGKWDASIGYGFGLLSPEHHTSITVLKLHGSANWLISFFGGRRGTFAVDSGGSLGDAPHIATDDLRFLGYDDLQGTFPHGAGMPSLILPGRKKEFFYATSFGNEHEEFFDYLWSQSARALRSANRMVVCGYGLLSVDKQACDLLLSAPPKDIPVEIVSGNDSQRIRASFEAAGFSHAAAHSTGYFEDWVRSQCLGKAASTPA